MGYRVKQAQSLLNQMSETQPKGGSSSAGQKSPSDIAYEKAEELLERLPEDYHEEDYKAKIQKLGGLSIPLNIFLFQEIQRLQEPKKLFVPLPVLHVSANDQVLQKKINKEMFNVSPYESPCYKYQSRTDRFFIFFSNLRCSADKNALFWGLRGVALLCNTA